MSTPLDLSLEFSRRCDGAYFEVHAGAGNGLREFARILARYFESDLLACLSIDSYQRIEYCFSDRSNEFFPYRSLQEWTEKLKDPESFLNAIRQLTESAARLKLIRAAVETPHGTVKHHLTTLRLPPVFEQSGPDPNCYICLLYEDPYGVFVQERYDDQLRKLAALVDTWAWQNSHHRMHLKRACRRLEEVHTDLSEQSRRAMWEEIRVASRMLKTLLTIPELIRIQWLWNRENEDAGTAGRTPVAAPIERDLVGKWDHQSPPHWPPREDNDVARDRQILKTLLYWCKWRDKSPERIGSIRRCQYSSTRFMATIARIDVYRRRLIRYSMDNVDESKEAWFVAGEKPAGIDESQSKGCLLGRKSLMRFFFSRALDLSKRRLNYWASDAPSDEEYASVLSHIAVCSHYLLGEFPSDQNTIYALTCLLSDYAHDGLGIPNRVNIRHHLHQAARGEPALHVLKRYYRDHFFHALEVCFLGHFILETTMKNGRRFWEIVADYLGCSGKENNVLRMWYLAALLHDIGYGVDLMKSIRHLLGFFSNAEPISQFLHSLESAFDSISDSMAREGFLGAVGADKVGEDHGMISARHLWALLEKIGKDDCSLDVGQYGPAIRAIGLHNSRVAGQGKNVAFRNDPIAFLLILCDTIQEWNRPRLGFETAPFQMLSWMQDAARDSTAEAPTSKLWLNATYRDDGHWKLCSDARDELTLRLEFTDRINKNDAVFFLWLDATSNLQRLDCTGLDIDINIEFITPFLTKPFSLGPQRQFYRLKDATRETHMGFLNRWFPSKPTGKQGEVTNGAVTYRTSRAPETNKQFEHVTLNLRNLTQSPLITKPMAEFLSCLRRWKNFHDNMEFLGDYGLPEYPS